MAGNRQTVPSTHRILLLQTEVEKAQWHLDQMTQQPLGPEPSPGIPQVGAWQAVSTGPAIPLTLPYTLFSGSHYWSIIWRRRAAQGLSPAQRGILFQHLGIPWDHSVTSLLVQMGN